MQNRGIRLYLFVSAFLIGTLGLSLISQRSAASQTVRSDSGAASRVDISTERIAKHIEFLASDKLQGRRAGTPGADEAAAYIEKEFRSAGLKPGSGTSFLERFTF